MPLSRNTKTSKQSSIFYNNKKSLECITNNFEKLNMNIHSFTNANIILISIATLFSCIGIITNNYQSIIASKIIGLALIPFISLWLIMLSGNIYNIGLSFANIIIFVSVCLIISLIIGFYASHSQYIMEPTDEMIEYSKYKYQHVILEFIITIIAGIGIYYSIMKTSIIAFVGLLLVISIIPAISNAGLCYGIHTYLSLFANNEYENNKMVLDDTIFLQYSIGSMKLFLVDITGVFVGFITAFLINCISY